jgi:hypothetical protein
LIHAADEKIIHFTRVVHAVPGIAVNRTSDGEIIIIHTALKKRINAGNVVAAILQKNSRVRISV